MLRAKRKWEGRQVAAYWIWWMVAGGLVVAELVTGTFFLLALGVAFGIGGLAALLGAAFEIQLVIAGIVAMAGIFLAHRWRRRNAASPPEPVFDIGQTVQVQAWNPDGTARVAYRGTLWQAEAAEILHAMQAQITAERTKRAVIATSEGRRQEQINHASGAREAAIAESEGAKQAEINNAQGEAAAILARAEATAKAIRQIADAIEAPGGLQAVNLRIAEQYIGEFGKLAKTNNTLIVPTNVADVASMFATAMSVVRATPPAAATR